MSLPYFGNTEMVCLLAILHLPPLPAALHPSLPCFVPRRLSLADSTTWLPCELTLAGSREQWVEGEVRVCLSHSLPLWHQIPRSSFILPWTVQVLAAKLLCDAHSHHLLLLWHLLPSTSCPKRSEASLPTPPRC